MLGPDRTCPASFEPETIRTFYIESQFQIPNGDQHCASI